MYRTLTLLAAALLALAACGDSTTETADTDASPTTTTAPATTTTLAEGACPAAPFTGTIGRTAESGTSDGTHVVTSRSDGELQTAYAYYFGFGGTYTVYVGDYDIDKGSVGSDTLVAPEGGLLATIFLQSEEELVPGQTLELAFVPIVDTGGGAEVSGFGADDVTGGVTIIDVTDERICFEIDTTDPQQRLDGTVSAEYAP